MVLPLTWWVSVFGRGEGYTRGPKGVGISHAPRRVLYSHSFFCFLFSQISNYPQSNLIIIIKNHSEMIKNPFESRFKNFTFKTLYFLIM